MSNNNEILPEVRNMFDKIQGLKPIVKKPVDSRAHLTGVVGIDPMSPYTPPRSATRYKTIADVMNRKGFPAKYPQSYTPIPEYFRKHNITPYFNPDSEVDFAKGSITIAGMIDLVCSGAPFILERDQDFDMVIAIATQYLTTIEGHSGSNKLLYEYARKVKHFLSVMEEGRSRVYCRRGELNPHAIDFVGILKRLFRKE